MRLLSPLTTMNSLKQEKSSHKQTRRLLQFDLLLVEVHAAIVDELEGAARLTVLAQRRLLDPAAVHLYPHLKWFVRRDTEKFNTANTNEHVKWGGGGSIVECYELPRSRTNTQASTSTTDKILMVTDVCKLLHRRLNIYAKIPHN